MEANQKIQSQIRTTLAKLVSLFDAGNQSMDLERGKRKRSRKSSKRKSKRRSSKKRKSKRKSSKRKSSKRKSSKRRSDATNVDYWKKIIRNAKNQMKAIVQ